MWTCRGTRAVQTSESFRLAAPSTICSLRGFVQREQAAAVCTSSDSSTDFCQRTHTTVRAHMGMCMTFLAPKVKSRPTHIQNSKSPALRRQVPSRHSQCLLQTPFYYCLLSTNQTEEGIPALLHSTLRIRKSSSSLPLSHCRRTVLRCSASSQFPENMVS